MSPNVAIARLWCPLGMLLAGVVKLGDLRCAGPVRQRSWRASLCLKKRGTRGVSESGGPMQFISEKFGFWSLARRLTVGAVAQAQRPLPGCIHYTLHAWTAEWGECVWVAEALKSRLPRCVPPCLVAFLVAIQLGVCVGRTWGKTTVNVSIAKLQPSRVPWEEMLHPAALKHFGEVWVPSCDSMFVFPGIVCTHPVFYLRFSMLNLRWSLFQSQLVSSCLPSPSFSFTFQQ